MKLKTVALACAAALALPMAAHAVPPANPYDTAGAMTVFLSGASAADNFLASSTLATLLKPGFYSYIAGNNYRLFLGETLAVAPSGTTNFPTNQKILFIKRSEGGSAFGVNPISRNSPIRTMILNSTVCPTPATAGGPAVSCFTIGVNSAIVGIDPGFPGAPGDEFRGFAVPADFGVSDVAPFMFKAPLNVEFGQNQLDSTSNLTIRGVNTLMLGYVATKDVADNLTISKADYHAMLTGSVFDWNTIGAGINTATDKKTQVIVCRGVPGSQVSYNWYFNQFPCTVNSQLSGVSGNTSPSRMTDSTGYGAISFGTGDGSSAANAIGVDVTAGYTVIENSGSGDVRACLRSAALNLDYTFQDEGGLFHRVNFSAVPAGHTAPNTTPFFTGPATLSGWRAIGTLSLDSQTNTSTTAASGGAESAWFFRPLNGNGRFYSGNQSCRVGATLSAPGAFLPTGGTPSNGFCPNRNTLRTGDYDFAAELTMQYRTTVVKDSFDVVRRGFVDAFIAPAGDQSFQALWTMALFGPFTPNGTNAVSFAGRQGNQCGPLVRSF